MHLQLPSLARFCKACLAATGRFADRQLFASQHTDCKLAQTEDNNYSLTLKIAFGGIL